MDSHGAIRDLRQRPTTQVDQGFQVNALPAAKFAAFIRTERNKWGRLVKTLGIPQN